MTSFIAISVKIVLRFVPRLIGIAPIQGLENHQRVLTKIFFVNLTVWPNDERLYSSYPVVRWCRGKTKAADHCAANDKIHLPHRRSRSLAF